MTTFLTLPHSFFPSNVTHTQLLHIAVLAQGEAVDRSGFCGNTTAAAAVFSLSLWRPSLRCSIDRLL